MRTRSAHDTKRLFRRFLSNDEFHLSTGALSDTHFNSILLFMETSSHTTKCHFIVDLCRENSRVACSLHFAVCRSVPFRRFFPRMSTSGWQTGRPRRRPRVALGCLRGDVRRGRARVAPARRAVPSGRPVDVVVRPERHGTPRGCRGSVASVAREAGAGEGGGGCARGEGAGARSLGDIRRRLIRAE